MLLQADDNLEVVINAGRGQVYSLYDLEGRLELLPGAVDNTAPVLALLDALKAIQAPKP